MNDKILIDTKEADRIAAALGTNRDGIIRRIAFDVESMAKQLAPYETTALRNSIYTETTEGNNFSKVSSEVSKLRPGAETIQHPKPDEGFVNVGPCVNYAEWVELPGNVLRGGQRPYLTPAAEQVAQRYNSGKEWEDLTK